MNRMRSRAALSAALALTIALLSAAAALAVGHPQSRSPHQNATVHVGHIRIVVSAPGAGTVYLAIRRDRRLDKYGLLDHAHCNVSKGCEFDIMKRWRGHRGLWTYSPPRGLSFPGYWGTTPGRYYWQASIVPPDCGGVASCTYASAIHRFRVVG